MSRVWIIHREAAPCGPRQAAAALAWGVVCLAVAAFCVEVLGVVLGAGVVVGKLLAIGGCLLGLRYGRRIGI